jgi:hypothetical protein
MIVKLFSSVLDVYQVIYTLAHYSIRAENWERKNGHSVIVLR